MLSRNLWLGQAVAVDLDDPEPLTLRFYLHSPGVEILFAGRKPRSSTLVGLLVGSSDGVSAASRSSTKNSLRSAASMWGIVQNYCPFLGPLN